jgi:hypothetical protein
VAARTLAPGTERRVPAYIPCHPKDLPTLGFCVEALRRHPQVTSISVIAPAVLEAACRELGVNFVHEETLLEPWSALGTPGVDDRWYYQMYLKLSVAFAPEPPDRYLIIDADTVLLQPFELVDEQTGSVLHPRMTEHVVPYYRGIRELLGHEVVYDGSYIAHFMVYRTPVVREMFAEFARVKGRPTEEGRRVLREFLDRCDRRTLSFADYETYGYFAARHVPGELTWARRRQLNVLYVRPSEPVLERLRRHYDFASFHAYRRPDRLALRVAGACWLGLRLLRDRLGRRQRAAAS